MKFSFKGKVTVITGGAGVLMSAVAKALAELGSDVALLDIDGEKAQKVCEGINEKKKGRCVAIKCNVLDKKELVEARNFVLKEFGTVDFLINGAGGNRQGATTSSELSFFDLPEEDVRFVFDLNFFGTFFASQIFGEIFSEKKKGVILNVSSMNSFRPLTRIPAYSAAKAAVSNFTRWLAVHFSQNYSKQIRVCAVAPGFFLTEQNRFLLENKDGTLTDRGRTIISHTPMARFGNPDDLIGAVLFLLSDYASFIHGIVLPIDGGFEAYSGV